MESAGKAPSDSDVTRPRQHHRGQRLRRPARPARGVQGAQRFRRDPDRRRHLVAQAASPPARATPPSAKAPCSAPPPRSPPTSPESDFELTPSSVIDALQPDSGSDFNSPRLEEGSDEFESTPLRKPSDSDVTAAEPGLSGINLSRPSDSGINLQMASGLDLDPHQSVELTPLSGDNIKAKTPNPPPAPKKPSLSATPPPGRRQGRKGHLRRHRLRGRRAVVGFRRLRRQDRPTGSGERLRAGRKRVLRLVGGLRDRRGRGRPERRDRDRFGPAGRRGRGRRRRVRRGDLRRDVGKRLGRRERKPLDGRPRRSSPATVLSAQGASAEWGGLWVGMLGVATVLMLLLQLVSVDLMRNLHDLPSDTPASGLVKGLSGIIAGK